MKVNLMPGRFDVVCETQEDYEAVVLHCLECGRLYRLPPDAPFAKTVRKVKNVKGKTFAAAPVPQCPGCVTGPCIPWKGSELLGHYPQTINKPVLGLS